MSRPHNAAATQRRRDIEEQHGLKPILRLALIKRRVEADRLPRMENGKGSGQADAKPADV
jgi:hypothetical protein